MRVPPHLEVSGICLNRYSPYPQVVAWFRAIRLRLQERVRMREHGSRKPTRDVRRIGSEETRGVAPPHILITGMGIGQ